VTLDFFAPPHENVAYLEAKKPELHFNYDEIMHEAHHKAFTVAKVTRLDLLGDIQQSLSDALKEGKPFEQWKEELKPTLQKKGWWGETEVTDARTGEVKEIYVGSRRLKTIYDTNMRVAYTQGRYTSQMESEGEYLYYSAVLDQLTRPDHQTAHGTLLPKDDPWWDTHYPPNGWKCRCKARVMTDVEAKRRGLKPSTPPAFAVDKDWACHVGKTDNLGTIYKDKVAGFTCKEKNAKARQVGCKFKEVVEASFKQDTKELALRQKRFTQCQSLFTAKKPKKIELCKSTLFGSEKKVLLSSDTVQSHKDRKEITAFDYSLIPQMLEGEKRVFVQDDVRLIVLKKLGRNYRLTLKEIKEKDEIFAVSLVDLSNNYENELKKLKKRYEEL